ncbi:diguanylate cyclase domain-containing protein [Lactiplantibacillus garii]|nr:diguanylate cyclase [Lactiplantibacillus garii]
MKRKSIDNVVFMGMLLILAYQYTLLYLSVIDGSWVSFAIVAATFGLGLLMGRTTYIILGGVLSFVSMSIGGLMFAMPYTRGMYLWGCVALMTITPLTTYLMYLLDHRLLKRKALAETLRDLQRAKPDLEPVTGAFNKNALNRAIDRELKLVFYHEKNYQFTLTLIKIDFLENIVNFLGSQRFNALLKTTAEQLTELVYTEDQLYYLGAGKFVILSPMLEHGNAPSMRQKLKRHVDQVAAAFELEPSALVLRTGQVTYSTQNMVRDSSIDAVLAQLERSAETDIVREYL